MVDLTFTAQSITVEPYAAVPTLVFKLLIANTTPDVSVQNVALNCQIRIDAPRRRYSEPERTRLAELFGAPERWGETLHSMLWTQTSLQVPGFADSRAVDMPVQCSFDFNIAATKYFHGLEGGEVPLSLLFSGTVFYRGTEGQLQMDQIAWSKEAEPRLPVATWQQMMDLHYPGSGWLRLDRPALDALAAYKRARGFTRWEQAIAALLASDRADAEAAS